MQRFGLMIFNLNSHTILQKWTTIAKQLRRQFNLIVGFHIHEH